jgi:hypothetical protein
MERLLRIVVVLLLLVGCSQNEKAVPDAGQSPPPAMEEAQEPATAPAVPDTGQSPPPVTEEAKEPATETTVEKPASENWKPLFDGESLTNWSIPAYGGDGNVDVEGGNIVIGRGEMMTGIRYEKEFPLINYELRYEARRTQGYDFFAACTFPVNKDFCSFINGGWGGSVTGLSSINGYSASENETGSPFDYRDRTWYRFRILVTDKRIQVWIAAQNKEGQWEAEQSVIDFEMEDEKELSIRMEMNLYKPLGFCTWSTEGQLRNIEYRVCP